MTGKSIGRIHSLSFGFVAVSS
jgi:hypothetical protein